MFTPLYYIVVGCITTLLQLNWKRRIYSAMFFLLLIFAPKLRELYEIDYETFYLLLSLAWISVVFILEKNRVRLFFFTAGVVVASHFSVDLILRIGSVELVVFGLMWHTYIDRWVSRNKEGIKSGSSKVLEMGSNVIFANRSRNTILLEPKPHHLVERERKTDRQIRRIEQKLAEYDEDDAGEVRESISEARKTLRG
tara:strand:- start:1739 stop:2329 length:591 start_codon:yes stop_codon:yes gene_type:complete